MFNVSVSYMSKSVLLFLVSESGGPFIDQILVLQSYAEGWTDGKWEEKVDERSCIERLMYSKDKQGYYRYGLKFSLVGAKNTYEP